MLRRWIVIGFWWGGDLYVKIEDAVAGIFHNKLRSEVES